MAENRRADLVESGDTGKKPDQALEALSRDLKRGLALTCVLLTLLTTGVQAALVKLLQLEDTLSLLDTFFRTAPLTIALALSTLWAVTGDTGSVPRVSAWCISTAFCLCLAAIVGNALGALHIEIPDDPDHRWDWKSMLERAMKAYYNAYGSAAFWSSIIVAGFLVFVIRRIRAAYDERSCPTNPG